MVLPHAPSSPTSPKKLFSTQRSQPSFLPLFSSIPPQPAVQTRLVRGFSGAVAVCLSRGRRAKPFVCVYAALLPFFPPFPQALRTESGGGGEAMTVINGVPLGAKRGEREGEGVENFFSFFLP